MPSTARVVMDCVIARLFGPQGGRRDRPDLPPDEELGARWTARELACALTQQVGRKVHKTQTHRALTWLLEHGCVARARCETGNRTFRYWPRPYDQWSRARTVSPGDPGYPLPEDLEGAEEEELELEEEVLEDEELAGALEVLEELLGEDLEEELEGCDVATSQDRCESALEELEDPATEQGLEALEEAPQGSQEGAEDSEDLEDVGSSQDAQEGPPAPRGAFEGVLLLPTFRTLSRTPRAAPPVDNRPPPPAPSVHTEQGRSRRSTERSETESLDLSFSRRGQPKYERAASWFVLMHGRGGRRERVPLWATAENVLADEDWLRIRRHGPTAEDALRFSEALAVHTSQTWNRAACWDALRLAVTRADELEALEAAEEGRRRGRVVVDTAKRAREALEHVARLEPDEGALAAARELRRVLRDLNAGPEVDLVAAMVDNRRAELEGEVARLELARIRRANEEALAERAAREALRAEEGRLAQRRLAEELAELVTWHREHVAELEVLEEARAASLPRWHDVIRNSRRRATERAAVLLWTLRSGSATPAEWAEARTRVSELAGVRKQAGERLTRASQSDTGAGAGNPDGRRSS